MAGPAAGRPEGEAALRVLITGGAGNLGTHLARHLVGGAAPAVPRGRGATRTRPLRLRLMLHRHAPAADLADHRDVELVRADLARPASLRTACDGVDCIVHFAGVLFAPRPERFLSTTNVRWVEDLVGAAVEAAVPRFILVSFPHVEGETSPERPATGRLDGRPSSVHAQTRLEAERRLFAACEAAPMTPVVLRPGMIYSRGVKMIDAARWLADRHLLAVWRRPTRIHLLALPDFNSCVAAAIDGPGLRGVYNLGDDDRQMTLQHFLDRACERWGRRRPPRLPASWFYAAGAASEAFATLFGTQAPLTRDFIRIGMASYLSDTSRMKRELLPELQYPTLEHGIGLL